MKKEKKLAYARKSTSLLACLFLMATLVACDSEMKLSLVDDKKTTIEYGTEVDFDLLSTLVTSNKKDTNITFQSDVEYSEVGIYDIQALGYLKDSNNDNADATLDFTIKIEDTVLPTLKIKDAKKTKEVEYGSTINIKSYIDEAYDKVGEEKKPIEENEVLSKDKYEERLTETKTAKEKINKRKVGKVVVSSEETKAENMQLSAKANYLLATHDIDTSKPGEYEIKVVAVDSNYNVSDIANIKVKVLEEGKKAENTDGSSDDSNTTNSSADNGSSGNDGTASNSGDSSNSGSGSSSGSTGGSGGNSNSGGSTGTGGGQSGGNSGGNVCSQTVVSSSRPEQYLELYRLVPCDPSIVEPGKSNAYKSTQDGISGVVNEFHFSTDFQDNGWVASGSVYELYNNAGQIVGYGGYVEIVDRNGTIIGKLVIGDNTKPRIWKYKSNVIVGWR
ncbi:hypothetical protein [Breznakia pachnodae]|uniref:Uncharacterized protein n=1 Tax=Breznakia pachnodae TaxID=265178 RepID=A0ABU0DY73_9FIRM|nr:hypothetical protein [Breznakia pachnodae]MDQ0359589.1 hypothetical protein [Breznakia pachnodae]